MGTLLLDKIWNEILENDWSGVGLIALLVVVAIALVIWRVRSIRKVAKTSGATSEALRDERLKSNIILQAIEDGVMLVDTKKTIQLFNRGAGDLTGWPPDEAVNIDYDSVVKLVDDKGELYPESQNPFSQILQGRDTKTVRDDNAILLTRSGKQIPISLSVSPLMDENKQLSAAVAIFRDVSQSRAEEQQRADFISTASHEMRTPVAAIEGYLSLTLNDKVASIDSRARSYLEKAHTSTQHLGQLFQDLLTSAKAEDGRLANHPNVVEFGTFLQQLSEDLKFGAEKKGLFTEFTIGSINNVIDASIRSPEQKVVKPLYYAWADPDRMREVITNLFDNAVKYTEQGKISLGLTGNDQIVQIYIRDTGPGIPREDVPHLFQKFYRVDNSATRTIGGTGLGLFICRKIVEMYQGRIWVESELDKGSTFYINLPRLSIARAEQLKAEATNQSSGATTTSTIGA